MNQELPDVQAGFRKGRRTTDQIANIGWIIEKARGLQKKNLPLLYWLHQSLWLCGLQNLWKILKEMGVPGHFTSLLRNWYARQEVTDMGKWTNSKLGKEYIKAVYCPPAYLTYTQSTSWGTLGWMKHKLESRFLGEISITSDMQMTPPYGRKWRGINESIDETGRGEWKSWLKTQHSEN